MPLNHPRNHNFSQGTLGCESEFLWDVPPSIFLGFALTHTQIDFKSTGMPAYACPHTRSQHHTTHHIWSPQSLAQAQQSQDTTVSSFHTSWRSVPRVGVQYKPFGGDMINKQERWWWWWWSSSPLLSSSSITNHHQPYFFITNRQYAILMDHCPRISMSQPS